MSDFIGITLILIGLGFDIFGAIGLNRLPDIYSRLQVTVKSITLGTCSILLGAFIIKGFTAGGIRAFLCMLFLLIVQPAVAHTLSKAAHDSGVKVSEKPACDEYMADKQGMNI